MPGRRNRSIIPQAKQALDNLKYEIASEINFPLNQVQGDYWGNISSAQCGAVGGQMVRRMIEAAERSLSEQAIAGVKAGFRAGFAAAGQTSATQTLNQPGAVSASQIVSPAETKLQ
ncbi:MAG TPA: alpha/beta-type small acid-soluble spore protein [Firmicutes bacterium]|nr:alpha/beta-type small acid-soluble spore protein [Bacillota bacterium]